jgi:hypothetical protein
MPSLDTVFARSKALRWLFFYGRLHILHLIPAQEDKPMVIEPFKQNRLGEINLCFFFLCRRNFGSINR